MTHPSFQEDVNHGPDAPACGQVSPALLAELVGVPLALVRRWLRRGLLLPVCQVHRLAYFDFAEVTTARRLAGLVSAGISPSALERQLAALGRLLPEVDRPWAQLDVVLEGRRLLLRQGDDLVGVGGQLWFDFDASDDDSSPAVAGTVGPGASTDSPDDLLAMAEAWEEAGQLAPAVEAYRAVLGLGGASAELSFRLAELLYRMGDVAAARERYYLALELDDDLIEARANLGCLLAEEGQLELAARALEGALAIHPDYADAHYHLARVLCEAGNTTAARPHWEAFLRLAGETPWADEARQRLSASED